MAVKMLFAPKVIGKSAELFTVCGSMLCLSTYNVAVISKLSHFHNMRFFHTCIVFLTQLKGSSVGLEEAHDLKLALTEQTAMLQTCIEFQPTVPLK